MNTLGPKVHLIKSFAASLKIGFAALLLVGFAPLQTFAQVNQSCNPDLEFGITDTPFPIFLGETFRISAHLGAQDIKDGTAQDITAFGYALNCQPGQNFQNCISEGNTVEFLGNLSTDCKRPDGSDVVLAFPQSNVIPITTVGGPIRTGANDTCNVQFDARIIELAPDDDNIVIQSMGWPIENLPATTCNNGLTSTASSTLAILVESCEIDVKKQVSVDGETWFDADSVGSAPSLPVGGTAYYRLLIENTGSADYVQPISVVDAELSINTTIPALAAGESVILTGDQIPNLTAESRCKVVGSLQNTANVGAMCRSVDSPVNATGQDSAYLVCTGAASIDIEKATNGFDADTPTGPNIPVGGAVSWTYVVTNTGELPLSDVVVTDNQGVAVSCPATTLAVAASMTCTANGTAVAGQYANIGTVNASSDGGPVTDDDPSHYYGMTPDVDIEKATNGEDADTPTGPQIPVGGAVNWTYVVTNTGELPLSNVVVTDDQGVTVSCPATTLAVGASMTCTASGTAVAGQYANLGTVNASSDGGPVTDDDPSHYYGTGDQSINILKEISVDGGNTWFDANTVGTAVVAVFPSGALYRFTVTNTGSVALKNVDVDDPILGITDYLIGNMAIGEVVVLTSGEISELLVEERCGSRGTFTNTATATGQSVETDVETSDSDAAVLKCIGEPHITILKEISPTGTDPWYDDITPPQEYPSDAWYRLTVTNDGTAPLVDVEVQDGDLGVLETIGSLDVGEVVVLNAGPLPDFVPELYVENRCESAGQIGNTASASGTSIDDPNDTVNDSDTATLLCVGEPTIEIIKEVSVDNSTWFDANTEGEALLTQAPSDAYYRFTVKNLGLVGLTNVHVTDGTLGIDEIVADIPAGQQIVLTNGDIPALYYQDRCTNRGTFANTATASGDSADTGATTSDTDAAWLECTGTPDIQIVKEISVDGGVTWYDGFTPSQLPPSDAWYRLTVTNTGTADLENVVVNDADLGVVDYPVGTLLIGEFVVLDQVDIPELYQVNRCTSGGEVVNTASANGTSLDYPFGGVNDSDSATLVCAEPVDICEEFGRPTVLKIAYNGTSFSDNAQDVVGVPDVVTLPATVTFKLYDKNDLEATHTGINVGDPMNILGKWTPSGKIPPNIKVEILDGTTLLQTIIFHGSCSAPLIVGDKFGGFTIIGFTP